MTTHPRSTRLRSGSGVPRALLLTATLLIVTTLFTSGCGRTITLGEAAPPEPPPAPAPTSAGDPGGSGPRVLDSSAEQNGETGDGGTVIGLEIQESPPRWVQLAAVRSESLDGPHLININQAALYRFDQDSDEPSRSTCDGECAQTWPPVTIEETGTIYLAGVDPEQVGAVRREDGDVQLTVGGWPVYRFAEDSQPGDLGGQGVNGTWFAVGPDGSRVS